MKISIIVSVYNSEKYLCECLESVCNQTMNKTDIEIILVDDASTDNSLTLGKICLKNWQNVIYIVKEKNEGTLLSRVDGISVANGEYITFLDGDDWLEENALEIMYENAKMQDADIIEGGVIFENGKSQDYRNTPEKSESRKMSDVLRQYRLDNKFSTPLWKRCFKKELLQTVVKQLLSLPGERKKLEGILNDDNVLCPIILASAGKDAKYYCLNKYTYHYRIDSTVSVMNKFKDQGVIGGIRHADKMCTCGEIVLEYIELYRKELFYIFQHVQVESIFSLLGYVKACDSLECIELLDEHLRKFMEIDKHMDLRGYARLAYLIICVKRVKRKNNKLKGLES